MGVRQPIGIVADEGYQRRVSIDSGDGAEEILAKVFFGNVAAYLDNHVAIERLIDSGERIVVIGRAHGTIKSTGSGFDVQIMHLWRLQDGLAVRLEIVLDVPTILAQLAA